MTIAEEFSQANIDAKLSQQILTTLKNNKLNTNNNSKNCDNFDIPDIDGHDIVDFSAKLSYQIPVKHIEKLIEKYPELQVSSFATDPSIKQATNKSESIELNEQQVDEIGLLLSPYFAFGVLNGGSASSYFDTKKNQNFSPELYELFQAEFTNLACNFSAQPKALCPAFLNPDGSYGPSFMDLKLCSLLQTIKKQKLLRSKYGLAQASVQSRFFQMTSELTDKPLQEYIFQIRNNPFVQKLITDLNWEPNTQISSDKQALISTFDYRCNEWEFFRDKNGKFLPMPGGHGQCFFTLRERLQTIHNQGIRYISLGNIDNVAYNPQSRFIGLLALSGRKSFFVCSYRSFVDIKGGVLLREKFNGKLNCFDIGAGVDKEIFNIAQQKGKELLFNCAISYFDLEALLAKLDYIIAHLPLRISEQNKDKGHYWQVEQITWEVIGLLDSVLIAAVRKEEHFLATKLQLEAFVNTGYRLAQYKDDALQELRQLAKHFATGYNRVLQRDCDFQMP